MNEQKIIETLEEMITMYNREQRLATLAKHDEDDVNSRYHFHTAVTLKISIDGIAMGLGTKITEFEDSFEVGTWNNGNLRRYDLFYTAIKIID